MFDIGFWEVIFIAVITLLVVGPERLPKVARTAGLWVGKIRGFVVSVKADIDADAGKAGGGSGDRGVDRRGRRRVDARQAVFPEEGCSRIIRYRIRRREG
jgi:Tat protein translocase TatB subunit